MVPDLCHNPSQNWPDLEENLDFQPQMIRPRQYPCHVSATMSYDSLHDSHLRRQQLLAPKLVAHYLDRADARANQPPRPDINNNKSELFACFALHVFL